MRLVVVFGTGTEVGKTWVSAEALSLLGQQGVRASARKPAQSWDPADPHPTDAAVLAAATGEPEDEVCPPGRSYGVAMAPPMAADALGLAVPSLGDLVADMAPWPGDADLGLVETAGGPRSPMASDGDGIGLATRLRPDLCVLVADAGLGTINGIRLCIDAIEQSAAAPGPTLVVLNRYDDGQDLHRRNRAWLEGAGTAPLIGPSALADAVLDTLRVGD